MYSVYVLISDKDNNFYIGQTNNLQSRIERHNAGYIKSTQHRRPLRLIFHREFESRADAMRFEKYLKSGYGYKYIKSILIRHGP